jgi:hypothetical protein
LLYNTAVAVLGIRAIKTLSMIHDCLYRRRTAVMLLMPSNTQVLSTGTYCFVMTLMASCATRPPTKEEMLWSSPPRARTLVC